MSLIADALKRAQRAAERLPSFPGTRSRSHRGPRGLPGQRILVLVGIIVVGGALVVGGRWLIAPRTTGSVRPAPPPLILEQTRTAPRAASDTPQRAQTYAAPLKPKDETTIAEVLAALQLKPEETPRLAPGDERAKAAKPPGTSDPRRERALQRARAALEGETPIETPSGALAARSSPASRGPSQESTPAPPSPKGEATKTGPGPAPPTVEVHASGKDAVRFFTEGLRYQREGRYAQAIEEYEKAISADPGNLEAYNNLGVLFKETGRLDQAVEAFQRALALDPKYEKALNNLGVVRYLKGQYEEAISLFKRAIVINATNLESHTNLGIIYLLAERLEDARGAFERALQLDPKHAETHYNLALLYERRGIWPKALAHYQRFIELASPKHAALVTKVRERLRILAERR